MKNIHILPTNKPSRLYLHSENELQLRTNIIRTSEDYLGSNQHIYITSDEEIKYDEYYLGEDNNIYCLVTTVNYNGKKIILTTDEELIKDGIQSIDDEFLEWFVKNPSCEEVEIERGVYRLNSDGEKIGFPDMSLYKIIIPKEEPKQLTLEEAAREYYKRGQLGLEKAADTEKAFLKGAKWQQERMYSEEEVLQLLLRLQQTESYDNLYNWFEQFKKK